MNTQFLEYPKKSHRKKVVLPDESSDLAELMGIYFGDGGLNNPWQFTIYLNSEADYEFSIYVFNLIYKLFKVKSYTRVRPKMKCRVVVATGIAMIDFLIEKGIVRGNKVKQQFNIPSWIYKQNNYELSFVRGLFDTDGGFYTHTHTVSGHKYTNLGFCFVSKSKPLLASTAQILLKYGINPHIRKEGTSIYLYSAKDIDAYMNIFGSSNPRLVDKYVKWRGVRVA